MKRHTRKVLDKTDKRSSILKAAVSVFIQKGFNEATIIDVAAKARISVGTVYLYFRDKEDLLTQAVKEIISRGMDVIRERLALVEKPGDRISHLIRLQMDLYKDNPEVVRLLVSESRQSEEFHNLNPEFNPFKDYLNYVTELCTEAIAAGEYRDLNPRTLAYIIVGTMDFVLTQWISNSQEMDPYIVAEEIRAILRRGIL